MKIIKLPNGQQFNADMMTSYSIDADGNFLALVGNERFTYAAVTPGTFMANFETALASGTIVEAPADAICETIYGLTPDPIHIPLNATPGQGDVVTINGNFSRATLGVICLEDAGGGQDGDGITMACTYVNATTITCVFQSCGNNPDNVPLPVVMAYYVDKNGNKSGTVSVTVSCP